MELQTHHHPSLSSSVFQKIDLQGRTTSRILSPSVFWVGFSDREPQQIVVGGRWMVIGYLFPQLLSCRLLNVSIIFEATVGQPSPYNCSFCGPVPALKHALSDPPLVAPLYCVSPGDSASIPYVPFSLPALTYSTPLLWPTLNEIPVPCGDPNWWGGGGGHLHFPEGKPSLREGGDVFMSHS